MIRHVAALAGLPVVLAANYFLRRTLEEGDHYIKPFLEVYYHEGVKALFAADYPFWKFLLPMREIGGSWTTTTLVLTQWVQMHLGGAATWYLFNGLLIVGTYAIAWAAFRSHVFAYTMAICLAFGTHLYHTHAALGTVSFCLLLLYYQFLLYAALRVIRGERPQVWRPIFAVAVLITALSYEGWLDVFAFTCLAAPMVWYFARRHGLRGWMPGLRFAMTVLAVTAASYVLLKTWLGYGQTPGAESDVVFNYPVLSPAIEDVMSKTIANAYIAATNFLPPSLVSSVAFYQVGGADLAAFQHGYHHEFSYLVPLQAMFFWRYTAGAVFALLLVGLVIAVRRLRREYSITALAFALFILMVLTGGPTHAMVKARPMGSMPLLGYHVMVGVIGASLMISYGLMLALRRLRSVPLGAIAVAAVWAVIFYGALARPPLLAHMAAQVGFGEELYPNPMRVLAELRGVPYQRPKGAAAYRLIPDDRNAWLRRMSDMLDPLPNQAPPLAAWRAEAGVVVKPSNEGYTVEGNDSSWGYQLTSPPIALGRDRRVSLRWKGRVEAGYVCLGVLDETAHWVVPADSAKPEVVFDTGNNEHVYAVLANCNPFSTGNPASRFIVSSMTYGTFAEIPRAGTTQ
jgi:hypothetical protein